MNAYDLVQYGDKIQKIFAEFQVKLDEKIKGDRTFTNDNYASFVKADPTDKKVYLRWILDSYVNGGIKLYEDLLSRLQPALEDYDYLKQAGHLQTDQKIIENYCGLVGCTKKFKEKPGLESLIGSYEKQLESHREKVKEKEQIKEDAERVFESDEVIIIHPKTEAASCHYGKGTQWCTAATRGENRFENYNKDGPLYIIIPKKPSYEGEKYQMHLERNSFMDEQDTEADILEISEMYPSLNDFLPFKNILLLHAIIAIDDKLVKDILSDKRVDPSVADNEAIYKASEYNVLEIVKLLLSDTRVDPSARENAPIQYASEHCNVEMVKLLLADPRVNPAANDNKTIQLTNKNIHMNDNCAQTLKLLLADQRVDPTVGENDFIISASAKGNTKLVKVLLADGRANPADKKNVAIISASKNGHVEVVRLLLQDGRANPADLDNNALLWASFNGHLEIVKLLLADERVNPADNGNAAIINASMNGHLDIVKLLLDDKRVNPTDDNNKALEFARKYGRKKIVKLLLTDPRVKDLDDQTR